MSLGHYHLRMTNFTSAGMRCLFLLLAFAFGMFYLGIGINFVLQPAYFAPQAGFYMSFGILLVVTCLYGAYHARSWFFALVGAGGMRAGIFQCVLATIFI